LYTIGGSLLVERFFSVPGMGPLLTDAINRYDTNVVQCLVILYTTLGILGVFLGDILMMLVDPRITLTEKGGSR
jgi:oligopeptide transport system permease protein